jgi:dipeptidyl-peptidase 4
MKQKYFVLFFLLINLGAHAQKSPSLSLEQIWKTYDFYPVYAPDVHHMSNKTHFTFKYSDVIIRGSYLQRTFDTLTMLPENLSVNAYICNTNETELLLATGSRETHRHSYDAVFYRYNLETNTFSPLVTDETYIRNPVYAPTGEHICYIKNNNLFVTNSHNEHIQITFDGEKNNIINGAPDWVYEEEFDMQSAFSWSPCGEHILFLRFNETAVPLYEITVYDSIYPTRYSYKYPKVGAPVSLVTAHVYSVLSGKTIQISIPESYTYIPEFFWVNQHEIALTTLDRLQQHVSIFLINLTSNASSVIYTYTSEQYVDIPTNFTPLPHTSTFIITDDRDGYTNLHLYDIKKGYIRQLTQHMGEITQVYGYAQKSESIYVQITGNNPLNRYISRIDVQGNATEICTQHGTHEISFNADFSYGIHTFSDASQIPIISAVNDLGETQYTWIQNNWLQQAFAKNSFTPKEFFTIPTSYGDSLYAWIIKPPKMKRKQTYPVIFTIYGGPTMQKVVNEASYSYFWYQFLAQNGYIVVSVDCRGVIGRGSEFRKQTYADIGEKEVADFAEAAHYISTLSFIDKSRIAIEGWSFGGYLAALSMGKIPDVFAAGVSIAPVTDWQFYDAIYTERYMQTPDLQADAYTRSSVLTYVDSIKKPILCIHGEADDNVHVQNTYAFARAMIDAGKQFEMIIIPNDNHSLIGKNSRLFMYSRIFDFYETHLK